MFIFRLRTRPAATGGTLSVAKTITIALKTYFIITAFFISLTLTSCLQKLKTRTIENEEIIIEVYEKSTITTVHQYIDIINKRWNKTERILKANQGTIDSVFIHKDTIYLSQIYSSRNIYDLAAIKFGYKIVLIESENK